ncbi:MAG: CopG family transcriptional regulator [Thermoplasmata archaeon]
MTALSVPTALRQIAIPEELAQGLEERIHGSGFASVDAFVGFVLARLLENRSEVPFSEEEEARLRERLRSLGYID